MVRSGQLWLYKTADLHIIFTLSFDPVDRFWQLKSHFGVVFQAKSNGEVTVHISWHGKIHLHNFWSSGQILTLEESFWGSFSSQIKWWGHCAHQLTWKITSDPVNRFWHFKSPFGVFFQRPRYFWGGGNWWSYGSCRFRGNCCQNQRLLARL